mmetsp:Transcript_118459/g.235957  ORF Transcript_118459/g.235957 Transcript_118459/m.235957 type:complete len:82 (-) Transcript_118459:112-357(-)
MLLPQRRTCPMRNSLPPTDLQLHGTKQHQCRYSCVARPNYQYGSGRGGSRGNHGLKVAAVPGMGTDWGRWRQRVQEQPQQG